MEVMQEFSRRRFMEGSFAALVARFGFVPAGSPGALEPPAKHPTMRNVPFERKDRVRVGIIGTGGRGRSLLGDFVGVPEVDVVALCDINPSALRAAQEQLKKAGRPVAAEYGKSDRDFENLNARGDVDLVIVATPWDWHVPMALHAMNSGKHVGVEVPAATTLADCWKLVDTSERTRRHCVILENCCYGANEMMVLNMCQQGVFGEITHGEAAYIHDLRGLLFADEGEGLWRRKPHQTRNANLYPTHGLGPVAQYMGVHRGDRFASIVSMSSAERSLTAFGKKHLKADDPKRNEKYVCGDMNTSIIRTEQGRTIMLQHDVVTPRPYSRHNLVAGTEGTFADYPARIYLDSMGDDRWHDVKEFRERYEHPLWKRNGDFARKYSGHGGMDFIMCFRLIECFRQGIAPDMDVYDAAAWSAPYPLSEASVRAGGAVQKFPDFTRGNWK
jgi:hypothetical protein